MIRTLGLPLFLNAIGITRFNHLKIIAFNKPKENCDGTETLDYSFNLNASYHPRHPYQKDIRALDNKFLVLIGAEDEANDPTKYPEVMQTCNKSLHVFERIKHLNIACHLETMEAALYWMKMRLQTE